LSWIIPAEASTASSIIFDDFIEKTEDAKEASQAFLEKRKPVWKGR